MSAIQSPTFCPLTLGWSLPESSPEGPSKEESRALLASLGACRIDWSVFGQHLAFDPSGYLRRRLFLNNEWEILLLCWLPGQSTAIHDHGASLGYTLVLMGDLVETTYRWRGEGTPMERLGDCTLGSHQVTTEVHDTIHTVSNRGAAPAASLHLYSPPLKYLHAYDESTGAQRYVEPSESRFHTR
jgi:predicted metal-dependent enzyme (double-stranded beta helix superfamily)